MDNPLVSILIPVYNRESFIEETVHSALNQTYKNIEIIIVDNNSTDKTWAKVKKLSNIDKRIKVFQNSKNIGPVKNWKRCIDEAKGIYGKILWSDDLISPSFLKETIPFIKNEEVGFVFSGTEIFENNSNKKSLRYVIGETGTYESTEYIKGILFNNKYPVSPGCALFRLIDLKRNLLIDIPNKVNSDFSTHAIGNDLLLFLLTASKYKKFAFINKKLSFFRAHEDSISVKSYGAKLNLHYMLAKAYFMEQYMNKELIEKFNFQINTLLLNYNLKEFNVHNISDFYIKNTNYSIKEYNHLLSFSKDFNIFYNKVLELKGTNQNYVLYGNGTVSKTIQSIMPERIISVVDISEEEKHPLNLKNFHYNNIIITVLGREQEIIQYLTNELKIAYNKIITFELIGNTNG